MAEALAKPLLDRINRIDKILKPTKKPAFMKSCKSCKSCLRKQLLRERFCKRLGNHTAKKFSEFINSGNFLSSVPQDGLWRFRFLCRPSVQCNNGAWRQFRRAAPTIACIAATAKKFPEFINTENSGRGEGQPQARRGRKKGRRAAARWNTSASRQHLCPA